MAQRIGALRLWSRFLSTSSSTSSCTPSVAAGSSAEIGVQEFLKAVGKGMEVHAEKVANKSGSFSDFLQLRSGRLKKLGIPCQQVLADMRVAWFVRQNYGLINPRIVTRKMSTSATLAGLSVGTAKEAGTLVVAGDAAQKKVAFWLFGCSGWVFSMVVLGGMTRLTRSGLSMTDWKFGGGLPPLNQEEWEVEFAKYQNSPEYRRINKGMRLEDFKFIYWMEYAHRMWGRGLGLVFAGPFAYFVAKGYVTRSLGLRLSALMTMGAGQGFVGWWMVKSGLEEPETEYAQPRVSPYRLAAHLTSAFVIYSGLFWTALSVAMPEPPSAANKLMLDASRRIRALALPVAGLVGLTAVSGAFVAGNDAGHAYNTFPKMGDTWIPDGIFDMTPFIRNFFENTATVQMDHRILAITTLTSIGGLWLAARNLPLNPAVKVLLDATLGMAVLQVSLGISTLLMYVPVSLGSAHQAGALTLFTVVLTLLHALRKPSPAGLRALNNSFTAAGCKQVL